MKNVLVIGGSAFTGRVFSIQASRNGGFNLHVVNRGNAPMQLDRVTQYKCDRHDAQMIAKLIPNISYDAVIDFCAYSAGDIEPLIGALGSMIKQYIFISTASVYEPAEGFLDEDAPLFDMFPVDEDEVDEDVVLCYIRDKIRLEQELTRACTEAGVKYTILRPSTIYGPFNYAPREPYYIELIANNEAVPVPVDATARFSFVYVLDIAAALMACIGDERAFDRAFNLAGEEALTYPDLISEFERCNGAPIAVSEITVEQIESENLPIPFPLTDDTLYDGSRFSKVFDFKYTPFQEGMEKTFKIFYKFFTS